MIQKRPKQTKNAVQDEKSVSEEQSGGQHQNAGVVGQKFGAHMSVAGGLENGFRAAAEAGCDCLQIFVKNQRQWSAKPLTDEVIQNYKTAERETGIGPVAAHASYLLNLASPEAENRERSIAALVDELERCAALGVSDLVFHPGAHMGEGEAKGCTLIAKSLNAIRKRLGNDSGVGGDGVTLLLETTAGQGSAIGYRLEHLEDIFGAVKDDAWLGVCIDTCHIYAAGYDIRKPEGYAAFVDELEDRNLLNRVRCIHVNDSVRECGSRVDRHAHIGKGKIGLDGFRHLVNDARLTHVPRILETPKGKDGRGTDLDKVNLKRLRGLIIS